MLKLKSVSDMKTVLKVRRLYLDSFPDFERLPFWLVLYKSRKNDSNLYVIYDDEQFVGLTNLAYYKDIVYLYYLAIAPSQQSQGYGSEILSYLKDTYPDKRILLNIEKVDKTSENYTQRLNRKKFYELNGFQNADFEIVTEEITYEILYSGAHVAKHEYDALFKSYLNPVLRYLFL